MEIRKLKIEDLDQLLELENDSFISPWSRDAFLGEINNNPYSTILVLKEDNILLGYIDYWVTFEVAQINKIAINKPYRRKGLASKLYNSMLDRINKEEVDIITLEVREDNVGAVSFYETLGFEKILKKPHYYDNGDNAWYMIRRLGEEK